MNQETKTYTLSCGIEITDARGLGCGVRIENHTRWTNLAYFSEGGFALNVSAALLMEEGQYNDFISELTTMKQALNEANLVIK